MRNLLLLLYAALFGFHPIQCGRAKPQPPPRVIGANADQQAEVDRVIALYRQLGYTDLADAAMERMRAGKIRVEHTRRPYRDPGLDAGYIPATGEILLDPEAMADYTDAQMGEVLADELFHHLTPGDDTEAEHRAFREWRVEWYRKVGGR